MIGRISIEKCGKFCWTQCKDFVWKFLTVSEKS